MTKNLIGMKRYELWDTESLEEEYKNKDLPGEDRRVIRSLLKFRVVRTGLSKEFTENTLKEYSKPAEPYSDKEIISESTIDFDNEDNFKGFKTISDKAYEEAEEKYKKSNPFEVHSDILNIKG